MSKVLALPNGGGEVGGMVGGVLMRGDFFAGLRGGWLSKQVSHEILQLGNGQ